MTSSRELTKTHSPFHTKNIACPICDKYSEQKKIKSGFYLEDKLDIDLRPKSTQWLKNVKPKVIPRYFHFWSCQFCHYTSDYIFWSKDLQDGSISILRLKKQFEDLSRIDSYHFNDIVSLLKKKEVKSSFLNVFNKNLLSLYISLSMPMQKKKKLPSYR